MAHGKNIFGICDAESEYARHLMEYLNRRRDLMLEVRVFTSAEALVQYAEAHPIEILLISGNVMCDAVRDLHIRKILILSDGVIPPEYAGFRNVFKYQPADILVREVMEYCGEDGRGRQSEVILKKNQKVVGIYNPFGYAFGLLLSLVTSELLTGSGLPVLYICLDSFSGMESFLGEKFEENIGDMMYHFRQSEDSFAPAAEGFVRRLINADFIPAPVSPDDLWDISGAEWVRMIRQIMQKSRYEILVEDIGKGLPDLITVLDSCDGIWIPVEKNMMCEKRMQELENYIRTQDVSLAERVHAVAPPAVRTVGYGRECIEELGKGDYGRFVKEEIIKLIVRKS